MGTLRELSINVRNPSFSYTRSRHSVIGSKFGGVLDMVTDRVSTCGLLVVVSHLYPSYALYFILLIVLDITSHWFHVMSVSAHHKSKEALEHRNALLQWYYSIYPLFGYCCVGTELFYILLYVLHHHPHPLIHQVKFVIDPSRFLTPISILLDLFLWLSPSLYIEAAGKCGAIVIGGSCHR